MTVEENKVVLRLEEYIKMYDELKEYKSIVEHINNNYDRMCNYLKEELVSSNKYDIENIIKENVKIEDSLNIKMKNYHYENLVNELIRVGITFDLIEKLVDSIIVESKLDKGADKK